MGCHERDRQLSRTTMALALHLVVPGPTVQELDQCRSDGHLPDRCGHHPSARGSVHTWTSGHTPTDPRPPPGLAGLEPVTARPGGGTIAGGPDARRNWR